MPRMFSSRNFSLEITIELFSESETEQLAAHLALCLKPGIHLYLEGDLGSGKTTLTRALLRALGHKGSVKSPTYALVEHYTLNNLNIYHLDLYRIADCAELDMIGIRDILHDENSCIVEWASRGKSALPPPALEIIIKNSAEKMPDETFKNNILGLELDSIDGKEVALLDAQTSPFNTQRWFTIRVNPRYEALAVSLHSFLSQWSVSCSDPS
ncbi:MAG: tRNA (adenosine(37)-N6)-threonylcarbamoyltransferase complex ATPase subunit type 1 TsaE [Pseudomonadota bacterium]